MARKTKTEPTAMELADKLLTVRQDKNVLLALEKTLVASLMSKIKAGERQDVFKVVPTETLRVTDLPVALKWATANAPQLITVNAPLTAKYLRATFSTIPEGFELKTTEQLRVAKDDADAPGVAIEV